MEDLLHAEEWDRSRGSWIAGPQMGQHWQLIRTPFTDAMDGHMPYCVQALAQ
jgi:hypothetical protein